MVKNVLELFYADRRVIIPVNAIIQCPGLLLAKAKGRSVQSGL